MWPWNLGWFAKRTNRPSQWLVHRQRRTSQSLSWTKNPYKGLALANVTNPSRTYFSIFFWFLARCASRLRLTSLWDLPASFSESRTQDVLTFEPVSHFVFLTVFAEYIHWISLNKMSCSRMHLVRFWTWWKRRLRLSSSNRHPQPRSPGLSTVPTVPDIGSRWVGFGKANAPMTMKQGSLPSAFMCIYGFW